MYSIFGHIAKNVLLHLFCYIAGTNCSIDIKFVMKIHWNSLQVRENFHFLTFIGFGIIAEKAFFTYETPIKNGK